MSTMDMYSRQQGEPCSLRINGTFRYIRKRGALTGERGVKGTLGLTRPLPGPGVVWGAGQAEMALGSECKHGDP